jgi:release factor glutamine methyltransferase
VQLRQALNSAIERLTAGGVPSPRMNAELLLMFTIDCDRAHLYGHPERELTAGEVARYDDSLARRASGVPAQYITGHQEFWGMDLIVSPAVLIPRPETEHVVETALELITRDGTSRRQDQDQMQLPRTGVSAPHKLSSINPGNINLRDIKLRIADVGTGSGAIALALARELPFAEIHAIDISAGALEVARANAARHDLSSRITFYEADLLAGQGSGTFDFVVSNPPYVGESEEDQVQLDVRKCEPRNAVFAGPSGLEVIGRLIPQARVALRPEGWLVFEISGTIADGVQRLLADWDDVAITNDLQGIPRVARARKPTSE